MKKQRATPLRTRESTQPLEQIQDKIRQRAHELYELRGGEDGHDLEDWLIAESEVTRNSGP
jgi:hypothetical protein